MARRMRRSFLVMFIVRSFAALLLLPFLEGDLFIRVTHALALVRFRRAASADFRRPLPHALPVGAPDQDLRQSPRLAADALRHRRADPPPRTARQIPGL